MDCPCPLSSSIILAFGFLSIPFERIFVCFPIGFGFIILIQVVPHFTLGQFVNSHPRGHSIYATTPQAEADDFVENGIFHFSALLFSWNIYILSRGAAVSQA
jgi:hypothetical protein